MAEKNTYRFKPGDGNQTNNQTMLIIAILVVLILIIGGALIIVISQNGVPPSPLGPNSNTNTSSGIPSNPAVGNPENTTGLENNTGVGTNASQSCDDQCLFDRALAGKNVTDCKMINSTATQQNCYEMLSNTSLDACKLLSDVVKKGNCLTAFAVATNDTALCDLLIDGKDACKLVVNPCISITNPYLCNALQKNDPSECRLDTACLVNYSALKKNSAGCSLITDSIASTACISNVQHTDQCFNLPHLSERDYCYEYYAIYSGNYFTCGEITPNTIYALDCYSTFAARTGNLSLCFNDDFDLNKRWACYKNYSLATGDLSGCQDIDELATTSRFGCVFDYAKKYGNPSACQVIESLSQRATCYEGTIIYSSQNLNWQYCANVTNFNWHNKCYIESAKLYNNITLCDYVYEDFGKQSCRDSYMANKTKS